MPTKKTRPATKTLNRVAILFEPVCTKLCTSRDTDKGPGEPDQYKIDKLRGQSENQNHIEQHRKLKLAHIVVRKFLHRFRISGFGVDVRALHLP